MSQTTEKAFETYVTQMLLANGWHLGSVSEWHKEQAPSHSPIQKRSQASGSYAP